MKKVVCSNINGVQTEVDASQLTFRPSVYGVLIENGFFLLSKQWDGYDFPGGGIKVHETIEEALKREFLEETGICIEVDRPLVCGTSFFNPDYSERYKGQYWNCPVLYFLVKRVGGELSKEHLDTEELKYADMPEWVEIKTIDSVKLYSALESDQVIARALE